MDTAAWVISHKPRRRIARALLEGRKENMDHAHAHTNTLLGRDVARARVRVEGRGRPETLAPPVHQQLAVRRGVAEANKAAAQLHLARIRADRGEDLQVEDGEQTLEQQRQIRPVS